MSWNYRVLAHKQFDEIHFYIHEVYYDKDGKPDGYTERPVIVNSDSIKGMRWVTNRMKEALSKPILKIWDFPNEYKDGEDV